MPKSVPGVMKEYAEGKLHSGKHGPVVKDHAQAVAIALSEQRQMAQLHQAMHKPAPKKGK